MNPMAQVPTLVDGDLLSTEAVAYQFLSSEEIRRREAVDRSIGRRSTNLQMEPFCRHSNGNCLCGTYSAPQDFDAKVSNPDVIQAAEETAQTA